MMNFLRLYRIFLQYQQMSKIFFVQIKINNRKVDDMCHKRIFSLVLVSILIISLLLTGCSKDEILEQYNNAIQSAGNTTLTSDFSLKGNRAYGDDHYTGTYSADYKDFSETEYLFGGTSIERENGKDIFVSCDLEISEGTAQVFWISGSDDPIILIETNGSYSETITLSEGGNYIGITGSNFTGHLEMNIE